MLGNILAEELLRLTVNHTRSITLRMSTHQERAEIEALRRENEMLRNQLEKLTREKESEDK